MLLAKHQVKKVRGNPQLPHFPTGAQDIETGQLGWFVHDPHVGKSRMLSRTLLADEFLAIAAVEPEFPHVVPIGGPLGDDRWSPVSCIQGRS